jgi:hypothetical protein
MSPTRCLLPLLAALACAPSPPTPDPRPASAADVAERFVQELDLPGLRAEVVLADRSSRLVFFRVVEAVGDESILHGYAVSDGRSTGWLEGAGPRGDRFHLGERNAARFTPDLLTRVRRADRSLARALESRLAADAVTPGPTLVWLIETDAGLREALLRSPRVSEDLDLLARFPEPRWGDWRNAVLRAAARRGSSLPARYLDWILPLRPSTDSSAGLAVMDHPAVREDPERLLLFTEPGTPAVVRGRAMRRLVALPRLSARHLRRFDWWEVAPGLIRDDRVQRDTGVLYRVRWAADADRFAALRAEADRLLLALPETDRQTIMSIADEASVNSRRCRPRDYPSVEIAAGVLGHPRVAEDPSIASAFLWTNRYPEVRAGAFRVAQGREPPPPRDSASLELAWLRTAMSVALTQIDMTDDWAAAIALLDRWTAEGRHPVETAAWRSILVGPASTRALYRGLHPERGFTPAMLRANPLLALIPRDQLNDLGVACELLDR